MDEEGEEKYYVLHMSEDGLRIEEFTQDSLVKEVLNHDDGEAYYGTTEVLSNKEIKEVLEGGDPGYWPRASDGETSKLLIIKGKIVTPKPVKVVEKYTIE